MLFIPSSLLSTKYSGILLANGGRWMSRGRLPTGEGRPATLWSVIGKSFRPRWLHCKRMVVALENEFTSEAWTSLQSVQTVSVKFDIYCTPLRNWLKQQ